LLGTARDQSLLSRCVKLTFELLLHSFGHSCDNLFAKIGNSAAEFRVLYSLCFSFQCFGLRRTFRNNASSFGVCGLTADCLDLFDFLIKFCQALL
jgi:hypothetical protein